MAVLYHAFADGKELDPADIDRIFRETGKSRRELEQAVSLLEEHRRLQAELAQLPRLQSHFDDVARALSDSDQRETPLNGHCGRLRTSVTA